MRLILLILLLSGDACGGHVGPSTASPPQPAVSLSNDECTPFGECARPPASRRRVLLLSSLAVVDGDRFRDELGRMLDSMPQGGKPRRLAFVPTASRVSGSRAPAAADDADELRRQRALRADTSRKRAENLACALGASLFELHLDDIADAAEAVAREGSSTSSDAREVELAAAVVAAEALDRALEGTVAVLVGGGNTFFLASTLRRAGLGTALRDAVTTRNLVYIGQSAGAIVAGASIATALWKGWDALDFGEGTGWTEARGAFGGLALLGSSRLSLFPHYEAERWGALVAARAPELRGSVVAAAAAPRAGPLTLADAGDTVITPELVALPDNYALLWDQSGEEVTMRLYNSAGKSWAVASADDGLTWHAAETAPACTIKPAESPSEQVSAS